MTVRNVTIDFTDEYGVRLRASLGAERVDAEVRSETESVPFDPDSPIVKRVPVAVEHTVTFSFTTRPGVRGITLTEVES